MGSVIERSIGSGRYGPLPTIASGTGGASAMKLGLVFGYWGAQPRPDFVAAGAGSRAPRLRLGVGGRVVGQRRVHVRARGSPPTPRRSRSAPASCRSRPARRPPPRWPRSRSTTCRNGRLILGLGVSGPQVVEGWYGRPSNKPLARTREYVDIIRQALAPRGSARANDGEFYPLPYRGEGSVGPRQAAQDHDPPAARRDPDLPRRRRPEERHADRRDRRRLAAALLLAVPARGLRRPAART